MNLQTFGLIPTLNKMGYMTTFLDCVSKDFIRFSLGNQNPAMDVGCAFGVASIPILLGGRKVFCNDLDARHLLEIKKRIPSNVYDNLVYMPGDFSESVHLPNESIGSILFARVLHFFNGDKIIRSLKKAFDLLAPGGKLFIVADTPYRKNWSHWISTYESKLQSGAPWPGETEELSQNEGWRNKNVGSFANWLDVPVLKRTLEAVGFSKSEVKYLNRQDYPDDVRLDGRESVGAIAVKP